MKRISIILLIIFVVISSLSHCQHITDVGLRLIKHEEGERLYTYKCIASIPTIGVGHTGKDVKMGMRITPERSMELLRLDVVRFENYVNSQVTRILEWYERDALISFAFNVGYRLTGNIRRYVNNGQEAMVKAELRKYCRAKINGILKPIPRLLERREREGVLYADAIIDF